MKFTPFLLFLYLFFNPFLVSGQGITTIDFVKIIDGRQEEALFYYANNWAAFRSQALSNGWISGYQLLEADQDDWNLMLLTSYADSTQFKAIEERFAGWRQENILQLLNELKPNEFRQNVQAVAAASRSLPPVPPSASTGPCSSAAHRAFDFWIGSWTVNDPEGKLAGYNRITPIQTGCGLHESWTSADGAYRGSSYNFYDVATGTWHQSWIDNQGGVLQLSGGLEGQHMVLTSQPTPNEAGERQIDRISWIPNADGSLEQIWEKTTDNGESWQKVFHGRYRKN